MTSDMARQAYSDACAVLRMGQDIWADELRLLFGRHGVESPDEGGSEHAASASLNEPDSPPLCAEKEKMAAMIASVRIVLEATLRARMSTFLVSSARFMPSIISPEREYAKKSNNFTTTAVQKWSIVFAF